VVVQDGRGDVLHVAQAVARVDRRRGAR
jgi:hypothetical protein